MTVEHAEGTHGTGLGSITIVSGDLTGVSDNGHGWNPSTQRPPSSRQRSQAQHTADVARQAEGPHSIQ